MNKKYINLELKFPGELKDFIIADISDLPFLGIIENEESLILSFDQKVLDGNFLQNFQSQMNTISDKIAIGEFEEIQEINWNKEWEKEVPAINISRKIGIAPEWKLNELNSDHKIIINPKMSFGTGGHETTRLCSLMLEKIDLNGKTVIDAGTGTGILAIISILFGANKVIAFDNNEWSIRNATENFALNNVQNKIELDQFDLDENNMPQSQIVIANILANVIIRNMQKFYEATLETFIASGILIEQENDVIQEAVEFGFILNDKIHENEWTVLKFEKK